MQKVNGHKIQFLLFIPFISFMLFCSAPAKNEVQKTVVFDYEEILLPDQEKELTEMIIKFESETGNEIAIVTTPDIGTFDKIVDYAVDFGNRHGVGKEPADNGLVLVFSKNLRQTYIATGYGTEKVLDDKMVKQIIDSTMIPFFKAEAYFNGLESGLHNIMQKWNTND